MGATHSCQPYRAAFLADRALAVIARPPLSGFAGQLEWKDEAPTGREAWEFQNARFGHTKGRRKSRSRIAGNTTLCAHVESHSARPAVTAGLQIARRKRRYTCEEGRRDCRFYGSQTRLATRAARIQ